MKQRTITALLGGILLLFAGCEDPIDVTLDEGKSELIVDAFLTSIDEEQEIFLSMTTPYFDNDAVAPVTDATVTVTDSEGNTYDFTHEADGRYTWYAGSDQPLATAGRSYSLTVVADAQTYVSQTECNPVPVMDSLVYEFRESEVGAEEGYYAAFWARDFEGTDDFYWIKSYRLTLEQDSILNPEDSTMMIAVDRVADEEYIDFFNISRNAAFGGDGADGFTFILPIREFVTDPSEPFLLGEGVRVELWAITEQTWNFLNEVNTQINNEGLFATPAANVRTNIFNANSSADETAVGWFNVSAVSVEQVKIEE